MRRSRSEWRGNVLAALSTLAVMALAALPALAQDTELTAASVQEEPRLTETGDLTIKRQWKHVWVTHYGEYVDYLNDAAGGDGSLSRVDGHIYASNFAVEPTKVRLQGLAQDGTLHHERDFTIAPGATTQLMPERDQYGNSRELTWIVTSDRQLIVTGYAEVHLYNFDEDEEAAFESRAVAKRDLTIVEADCALPDHVLACASATRQHAWETWLD